MHLHGIHHVTAVSGRISDNHRFYTGVLGMRLVKRTVNQDDVRAYHLFYADALGSPGTDLTFFDWDVPAERRGTHSVTRTHLRVSGEDTVAWWADRLGEHGVAAGEVHERDGRVTLDFEDPEGQRLALVDDGGAGDEPTPWRESPVPAERQVRGLGPVVMSVPSLTETDAVLALLAPQYLIDPDTVAEAAIELADRDGLDALSMRRLGRELGVDPMSAYNHVRDKDDLLDRVVDAVASGIGDVEATGTWREKVVALLRGCREVLLAHPGVASLAVSRPTPVPGVATAVAPPSSMASESLTWTSVNSWLAAGSMNSSQSSPSTAERSCVPPPAVGSITIVPLMVVAVVVSVLAKRITIEPCVAS
ncbi:MAG: VOC family protein, partial [Gemmatimonadetes bacterium]|nr:VOC family protein [Gemmatimonadota bacterium]